ncbi:WD repeat-containing protein 86 isoform X2 [Podarcis raffonei]|uniref:WD repeat-containing protein 86 isoform X2 n=1 Tax=Podarcis raffonei TaxID=65483 RepID=UPI0023299E4F|nr:WD repeat-containing protein 86 isoform X2 [Podarcis raffonei]
MGSSSSALKVCTDHQGGINWLSLSPDGQWLLTGSEDGTARLWSTADSQCRAHFQGHESYITFCHLENEAAFTCSADHTIRKWDVMTGQCLAVYRGHTSIVNRILVFKDYLFSGSYDRTARCWSVDKEKPIQEFRGHRNCVLTLALYSSKDVLEDSEEEELEEEKLSRGFLVTGSTDCTVKVWWVSSGRCHQTLLGHTGAVLCLILDAPNRELFSGSTDYTIRTWNIVTGEQLRVFKEHQGSVICLELVNRRLYSGSADRTVKCWLADTGERVRTFKAHKHSVSTLKYHAGIYSQRITVHGLPRRHTKDLGHTAGQQAEQAALEGEVDPGQAFSEGKPVSALQQQSGLHGAPGKQGGAGGRGARVMAGLVREDRKHPVDYRRERLSQLTYQAKCSL